MIVLYVVSSVEDGTQHGLYTYLFGLLLAIRKISKSNILEFRNSGALGFVHNY